jgi:hypothetical protein
MKDIEVISREYQQLVRAIDDVNDAVIILKMDFLFHSDKKKFENLKFIGDEKTAAKGKLISFVDNIIGKGTDDDGPNLPDKVLKKFKGKFDDFSILNRKLKGIKKNLEEKSDLNKEQFDLLDKIITVLDMERSEILKN